MQVVFFNNQSDKNRVSKNISAITEKEVQIVEPSSIMRPRLLVSFGSILNSNYVYIPKFKRYYYIEDINVTNNGMYIVDCKVDVLMSNINAIMALNCFVERNEFNYNPYYVDERLTSDIRRDLIGINVGSVGNSYTITLTVAGGDTLE